MGKEERERERKMVVGLIWNCGAELKILLSALLFVGTLVTILQFTPFRVSLSAVDVGRCLVSRAAIDTTGITGSVTVTNSIRDSVLESGVIKRRFRPVGFAAYNYIMMSAYRGGPGTFAVIGLGSKPLHVFGTPTFRCEWVPKPNESHPISVPGRRILPDWGYGRVYTVVVVNCTFPFPVGATGSGGKLVLHASNSGAGDRDFNVTDTIVALTEEPGALSASMFHAPPKYDYLYCGSPLYGDLSPQRVREWIAYHARLFGKRSLFVFHDAGGIHPELMKVLLPWMELGYVILHDVRDQERFDGYYHNQFLIVNDCLHRYKFEAKWIFFFDVDEFIYVPERQNLRGVLSTLSPYSQFTIEQMPMARNICQSADSRKWGMEKLVYRDVRRGVRRDRKYAVQPRVVYATGVHMSQDLDGKTSHKTEGLIKYFHYHGTIAERREPCRSLVKASRLTSGKIPYELDTTMLSVAPAVKRFELKTVGSLLQATRQ